MKSLAPDPVGEILSGRAAFIAGVMAVIFAVISGRGAYLALSGDASILPQQTAETVAPLRANIEDRDGELLATTVTVYSLWANPQLIWDVAEVTDALMEIFPDLSREVIEARLNRQDLEFVWITRGLTPRQRQDVFELGLEGLGFKEEESRIYPHGSLAGHVLGYTNIDGKGIAGLEYSLNDRLTTSSEPVRITIDSDVQFALEDELVNAAAAFDNKVAAGIVLEANSGEVLAMASWPPLDPNRPMATEKDDRLNKASGGIFELGSVYKPLTIAAALDAGVVSLNDTFDLRDSVSVGSKTYRDKYHRYSAAGLTDIIAHSSNVGTVRVGLELGARRQQAFLEALGFMDRVPIELPESAPPLLPERWGELTVATVSFGHEMAISPLAFAVGFASFANEGEYVSPTLILGGSHEPERRRIMAAPTSEVVLRMMRETVKVGTGQAADIDGYRIAGKTGTAEKPMKDGYDEDRQTTSFAAIFPVDDPKYVVMIVLDEPKGVRETEDSAIYNAAPTAGRVIERIAPLLDVLPYYETDTPVQRPEVRAVSDRRSL